MKKNHLDDSYVRQNGKIFPWGIIRIFNTSVVDNPKDNQSGLAYWSSELIPYGNENHYAKIINARVVVFKKETDKKVRSISEKNLFISTEVWVRKVVEMGYLFTTGAFGLPFKRNDWTFELDALRKVAQDEPAPYCDNSPFLKVSEELIGTELIVLDLNRRAEKENYKIFTFDGKPINFKVTYPLRIN